MAFQKQGVPVQQETSFELQKQEEEAPTSKKKEEEPKKDK